MRKKYNIICMVLIICVTMLPINAFASMRFEDVPKHSWYNQCVYYCADNGIMVGVSEDAFEPERTITRAEFVTALYRLAGLPETSQENPFTDVPAECYYTKAVLWGAEHEIVYGVTKDEFAPDKEITREDMACLIARYVMYVQPDFLENGLIAEIYFSDYDKVSDYAKESVILVSHHSIMKGNTDGTFKPQDRATRAEVASVFMQLRNKLEGIQPGVLNIYDMETGSALHSYTLTEEDSARLRRLLNASDNEWTEFFVPEYVSGYELVLDNVKYQFESLEADATVPIRCKNVYGDIVYGMVNKDGTVLKQIYEILADVCSWE